MTSMPLGSLQDWMLTAITAPEGLPAGLKRAQARQGASLTDVVHVPPAIDPARRLNVYAQGYWLRLIECLKADFPALHLFLGTDLFEFFARAYLATHPSSSPSLYGLGNGLPRFLRQTQGARRGITGSEAVARRFAIDLARLEAAAGVAARAQAPAAVANAEEDRVLAMLPFRSDVRYVLPDTSRPLLLQHALDSHQPWLEGRRGGLPATSATAPAIVYRSGWHLQRRPLAHWQFHALAHLYRGSATTTDCAAAASRRTRLPATELFARLSLWLPLARADGMVAVESAVRGPGPTRIPSASKP